MINGLKVFLFSFDDLHIVKSSCVKAAWDCVSGLKYIQNRLGCVTMFSLKFKQH